AGTPPLAASANAAAKETAAAAVGRAGRRNAAADPPSPGSAKRDPLVAHEGHRVDERLAAAHDEVQVAAGGVPGGADACDELAGADLLTDVHADAARHDVRVAGVVAVAVLDADVVAPRAVPARVDDGAGVGRVDRDAAAAREVDARVVGAR